MATAEVQSWVGRSDEIAVPSLGADFWKEMSQVEGVLDGRRDTDFGVMYRLALDVPVSLGEEQAEVVEVSSSLTGVKNALQSLREKGYQPKKGDLWRVTCVGIKKAKRADFSDSPEFEIGVVRR